MSTDLYQNVVEWTKRQGTVSTSSIVAGTAIPFGKALDFTERMEREGIITAPLANGTRKVINGGKNAT